MSPDVLFNDIPDSVLDEVRLGIQHYFAPLLVLSPEHPKHPVDLAGSGTLVELAGRHYILTADHVWNATEDWDEIGLVVAAEGAPLASPRNNILPKRLHMSPCSQWGPDLALLEKPPTSGQYDTHTQVLSESGETTFDASISPAPDGEGSMGSHGARRTVQRG